MTIHHRIVIIGGGNAGISVAARLRNKGESDIAVIEPKDKHYYQPLWTMIGGGQGKIESTERDQASVMPQGVAWIKGAAEGVDPESNVVQLVDGTSVSYDFSWCARASSSTGTRRRACRRHWRPRGCPATTVSISPRRRGR